MQVKIQNISDTEIELTVSADQARLVSIKDSVVRRLSKNVKVAGFRAGKAPLNLVEKQLDQSLLQSEFLEESINQLYREAIANENLRPVERPNVEVKKFVPFNDLEFMAKIPVIGKVKLTNYKTIKVEKTKADPVTAKDINLVIDRLLTNSAEKEDVDRKCKVGDQVWIDFVGTDSKGEKVNGAEGSNYPLILGSDTFIPGFEANVIGLKAGEDKTFTLTFPKDYGVKALQNKKVIFKVTVTKVQEIKKLEVNDEFAKKVGPFKSIDELKEDIKKQLKDERDYQARRAYESKVLEVVTKKSTVAIPQVLIDEEMEKYLEDLKKNIVYRGQTYQEYLDTQGKSEEEFKKDVVIPDVTERVKASIILSEIAEQEKIQVTEQELTDRVGEMRRQYSDPQAQNELNKPEVINEIASRLLAEKAVNKLLSYVN